MNQVSLLIVDLFKFLGEDAFAKDLFDQILAEIPASIRCNREEKDGKSLCSAELDRLSTEFFQYMEKTYGLTITEEPSVVSVKIFKYLLENRKT